MTMQVIARATKNSKNVIVEQPQIYPHSYVPSQKRKKVKKMMLKISVFN